MKYIANLLSGERNRSVVFNVTFVFLFLAAWLSDRYPAFTLPAIAASIVVVGIQIAGLFFLAKQAREEKENSKHLDSQPSSHHLAAVSLAKQYRDRNTALYKSFDSVSMLRWAYLRNMNEADIIFKLRPRASQAETWALVALGERDKALTEHIFSESLLRLEIALKAEIAKKATLTAANWDIVPQGDNAFSIKAGPLEIEYFHGKTNIRVLDSSRVTVEGKERGSKHVGQESSIQSPLWH